jgi:hypothetical protein
MNLKHGLVADYPQRMPVAFGPMPGPRQNVYGIERAAEESTFTTGTLNFQEGFPIPIVANNN